VGVNDPARYRRLMDLFDRACALPDVERQALVEGTRTEEPELARDLEALLDQDRALGDVFMSRDGRIEAVATALARDDVDDAGPDRRPGIILSGRYRLEEQLGRGAVGQVYRAVDQATGDTVAIKLLNRRLVDDRRQARRFAREFRAIARIDHPGCLRVFAEGTDGADRYLVMEYVAGGNLTRLIGAPSEVLLPVLIGVAAALDDVHGHGIIHRDLKPANVLLTAGHPPTPKLADFGTVKLVGATSTRLTDTGALIGTVDYLAPDALGDGEIDSRSDLYSLGCMMFELWAGRPVFTGAPLDRLHARLDRIAPSLSSVARGVPAGLDDLVARLLARDPVHRPRRAVDVARDLMALWADMAPGDGARGRPPVGREPLVPAARIAVVRAAVAAVDDVAVRVVALSGAAEMGAAALADALAEGRDARELVVVRDASTGEPFAPFRAALAALDRAIGEPSLAAPQATSREGAGAELGADDAYVARRPVVRAVAARMRVLHQRRPVVLMLDDLHRAAGSAVELLLELVEDLAAGADARSDGVPPTLVVTIGPPGRAIIEAAAQEVPGTAAEPRSPGARVAASLACAASDDPLLANGAVSALLDRGDLRLGARGWGVRIIELAPELSGAVREVVAGRWAALAVAHRPILECAAVVTAAAPAFDVELLDEATGAVDGESRRALAEAERLAIVRSDSLTGPAQVYRFDSPQMGEAIHAQIDPATRANLHARVGALLERGGSASPARVAFHAIRGPDERFAFHAARGAGEAARAGRDHVAAAHHLELALAHVDHLDPAGRDGVRDDCTEQLAESLLASNRPAQAAAQLRPLAARPAAPAVRARRLRRLGAALVRTADPAAGVAALEAALVVLGRRAGSWGGRLPPGEGIDRERALLHRELATAHRWIDGERALDHLREVVRRVERLVDDAPPTDRGLARAIGDALARSAQDLVPGATVALFTSDPAAARRSLDRRARFAEASGDRLLESLAALDRGSGLSFLGDWRDAASDLARAEGLATVIGARGLAAEAAGRHAWLAAFRGELDTTTRTGRRLVAQAGPLGVPALAVRGAELLALAALLEGRPRDSLAHLDDAALRSRGGCHGWEVVTALVAAEVVLGVVDDEGADAVPDLDTRLKRSLRVMRAKPRARLASGYGALVSGVRASRVGWVRLASVRFARARALGAASDMTPLAPMVRARLAIEGCRLGASRTTAIATLDAVASELDAADLAGLRAWLARARRSHGL
jgi:hypothetical protein